MKYLAILGRNTTLSVAELEALFSQVRLISSELAEFDSASLPDINRLGGSLKLAVKLAGSPLDYFRTIDSHKLTLGVSDYSNHASARSAHAAALKLKQILARHGHSVRVIENKSATLATAVSLHNGLSGKNPKKCEFIKIANDWYRVTGVQDIDAYTRRDQARPARDAKVGMLPPKLAQILINLCGPLPAGARLLDPFCGTGVVLQEAILMGYRVYGTDLSERMVDYTKRNLDWLLHQHNYTAMDDSDALIQDHPQRREQKEPQNPVTFMSEGHVKNQAYQVTQGDATSFKWQPPIDAVAAEGYLGQPMSQPPAEIKLKTEKQACTTIITGFLKNLADQIAPDTPVTLAAPAWLRNDNTYSRIFTPEMVDFITDMGYNVSNKSREGLLYYREGQVVARDIIILRKS